MNVGRADINSLLSQMREMKAATMQPGQAQATDIKQVNGLDGSMNSAVGQVNSSSAPSFSNMLNAAVSSVNDAQQHSSAMKVAYEQGQPGVSLSQVMVASQKATVAFDAMTQVRNKVVEAYKDVMSMPV